MAKYLYGSIDGKVIINQIGNFEIDIRISGIYGYDCDINNLTNKTKDEAIEIMVDKLNDYIRELSKKGWKIKSDQINKPDHKKYLLEMIDE